MLDKLSRCDGFFGPIAQKWCLDDVWGAGGADVSFHSSTGDWEIIFPHPGALGGGKDLHRMAIETGIESETSQKLDQKRSSGTSRPGNNDMAAAHGVQT